MEAAVTFPALESARLSHAHADARAMRARFSARLAESEAAFHAAARCDGHLCRVVGAACRLATVERTMGGCGRAEAVLSSTLSFLAWLLMESDELDARGRLEACESVAWCAEELAFLYEDHDRPHHARVVREAGENIKARAVSRSAAS